MSFRSVLNNTAKQAPFPYEDICVQWSANMQRMPAMIARGDLDN